MFPHIKLHALGLHQYFEMMRIIEIVKFSYSLYDITMFLSQNCIEIGLTIKIMFQNFNMYSLK